MLGRHVLFDPASIFTRRSPRLGPPLRYDEGKFRRRDISTPTHLAQKGIPLELPAFPLFLPSLGQFQCRCPFDMASPLTCSMVPGLDKIGWECRRWFRSYK